MSGTICCDCYYGGAERCDATHAFDVYGKSTAFVPKCSFYENSRKKEDFLIIRQLHWTLKQLKKEDRAILYNTIKGLI